MIRNSKPFCTRLPDSTLVFDHREGWGSEIWMPWPWVLDWWFGQVKEQARKLGRSTSVQWVGSGNKKVHFPILTNIGPWPSLSHRLRSERRVILATEVSGWLTHSKVSGTCCQSDSGFWLEDCCYSRWRGYKSH